MARAKKGSFPEWVGSGFFQGFGFIFNREKVWKLYVCMTCGAMGSVYYSMDWAHGLVDQREM